MYSSANQQGIHGISLDIHGISEVHVQVQYCKPTRHPWNISGYPWIQQYLKYMYMYMYSSANQQGIHGISLDIHGISEVHVQVQYCKPTRHPWNISGYPWIHCISNVHCIFLGTTRTKLFMDFLWMCMYIHEHTELNNTYSDAFNECQSLDGYSMYY